MGYGYHGDNKKIGINQPLLCTVTLNDFKPESVYKKEMNLKSITAQNLLNSKDSITKTLEE
jgi:hypothetical protein